MGMVKEEDKLFGNLIHRTERFILDRRFLPLKNRIGFTYTRMNYYIIIIIPAKMLNFIFQNQFYTLNIFCQN